MLPVTDALTGEATWADNSSVATGCTVLPVTDALTGGVTLSWFYAPRSILAVMTVLAHMAPVMTDSQPPK